MDPITLGIVTAAVGALVTVAAKRWVFPFMENCFKYVKNLFNGKKSENHPILEKEKTEETPQEETAEEDETKSATANNKKVKNTSIDLESNLENENYDAKSHLSTEISVEETAKQEHNDLNQETDKLIKMKNKLHNSNTNNHKETANHKETPTPEQHYHNHKVLGPYSGLVVAEEDRHHHHHTHFDEKDEEDEEVRR